VTPRRSDGRPATETRSMPIIDPTSPPTPSAPSYRADADHSLEDVARMQALAVRLAAPANASTAADAPADSGARPRNVSGRYRGRSLGSGDLELELRVDADGRRPLGRVSGDFFHTAGGTVRDAGSFVVTSPTITVTPGQVVLEGLGEFTFQSGSPRLRLTIPRVGDFMPPAAADAQFLTADGVPGLRYACRFESPFFRRVELEAAHVSGVTPFVSYDTALLPSGGRGGSWASPPPTPRPASSWSSPTTPPRSTCPWPATIRSGQTASCTRR